MRLHAARACIRGCERPYERLNVLQRQRRGNCSKTYAASEQILAFDDIADSRHDCLVEDCVLNGEAAAVQSRLGRQILALNAELASLRGGSILLEPT